MVSLLMLNPEIIEAPTGASKLEQLAQHLENYCTSRTAEGSTKEDMEVNTGEQEIWNGNENCGLLVFKELDSKNKTIWRKRT